MITVNIEIQDDDNENYFRVIRKSVNAINRETVNDLLKFAATKMKEGECVYQMCAKRPHVKDEELAQPFWDYYNTDHLVDWWNS